MIDLALLRDDPQALARAWADRGVVVDVEALVALDATVRNLKAESEQLRHDVNAASKAIGQAASSGQDVDAAKEHARSIGERAKQLSRECAQRETELRDRLLELPNPCLSEVPVGRDETENVVVSSWGAQPRLDCEPRPHWEIGPDLGILDCERAARLSGSGFVCLRGDGARLVRALVAFFIDVLTREHDYTELMVPYLVTPQTMQGTGQLPKFQQDLYHCERDDLYLIPTAEVPVTNLHGGEILPEAELPLRYCAHTPCFRREAGAAGVGTRGMTRVHQFDKVEMVWLSHPERSATDLAELRSHAETMLQRLGLHYRVLDLCTGDTGFSSAHTYDLEVWSPGTGKWLEVSSCSTFTDFQARRAGIRMKPEAGGKPRLVHTLNGSGLAIPRCLISLLESNINADGTVTIPEVLRPYLGGQERIERR